MLVIVGTTLEMCWYSERMVNQPKVDVGNLLTFLWRRANVQNVS